MKRFLLCLSATVALCSLNAQTYTVKKGKINADDLPIAKYDGKGGLFKNLKIKITSLDGQPLINIEVFNHDFQNPLLKYDKRWFVANFPGNPEKKLVYKMDGSQFTGEKGVLNILFQDAMPALIKDNKLDTELMDKFIAANSYDYYTDSLSVIEMEKENKTRISTLIPRDTKQPFELKLVSKVRDVESFDIYQANLLIGRIEKKMNDYATGVRFDYTVWMKTAPYSFEGKEYRFSPVAFFKSANPQFDNDVILMKDKSIFKFKTPGSMHATAEYAFVNHLIKSGNL